MIRTALLCFAAMLGVVLNAPMATAATGDEADLVAERLLFAIGGRPAWAALTSSIVYTQLYGQNSPDAVDAIITTDYAQRRFRIDAIGANLHLVRVVESGKDRIWRLDRGQLESKADVQGQDLSPYIAHVFRTLQRLAVRDPALRLTITRKHGLDGLDVHEGDARIAWYRLDARSEPAMIGAYDDNVGVICGPWEIERDRIRYPAWLTRPDGSWRVTVKSLAVNVRTDEGMFSQPVIAGQTP